MVTLRSPLAYAVTVSVALVALAVGAAAQTVAEVQVRDNAFVGPDGSSTTQVTSGDIVRWRWVGDNEHTVTSLPTSTMTFDSDGECPQGDREECRTKGNVFEVRFDEPGTYRYICKVHGVLGMAGSIEVTPREDDGGGGAEPPPPGDPTGDQSDDESPPDEGNDSDGPGETDDGSDDQAGDSSGSDGQTAPSRRRAAGQSAPRFVPGDDEVEGDPGDGPDPDVAPPDQDFSPFPSPPPADGSERPDAGTEEMGVAIPGPDGPNRNLLIGIATGLLALTGGSVLKVLLAGPTA